MGGGAPSHPLPYILLCTLNPRLTSSCLSSHSLQKEKNEAATGALARWGEDAEGAKECSELPDTLAR